MPGLYRDGVVRRPLHIVDEELYELPIIFGIWNPNPPNDELLELLSGAFKANLSFTPERPCGIHSHPAQIRGFYCCGKDVQRFAEDYAHAMEKVLRIELAVDIYDNWRLTPNYLLPRECRCENSVK